MRRRNLYVDMDGVMVNINKGFAKVFNIKYPRQSLMTWDWVTETAGITTAEFWGKLSRTKRFYADLEPFPWSKHLWQFLNEEYPDWRILTGAPEFAEGWRDKVDWITKHLGKDGMRRLTLSCSKDHIAGDGDVLVDDHHVNIAKWQKAGGVGHRWVEHTEDHPHGPLEIDRLRQFLKKIDFEN